MRLYVVADTDGRDFACTTSKAAAIRAGRASHAAFVVARVVITMPLREVVRRLLGNRGGYAEEYERIIEGDVEGNVRPALL